MCDIPALLMGAVRRHPENPWVVLDTERWLTAPFPHADGTREAARRAAALIRATLRRQGVVRDALTWQADNGAAMASPPVATRLTALGVTNSHSRSHTSHDHPYTEAPCKTLKDWPDFPDRFPRLAAAFAPHPQVCRRPAPAPGPPGPRGYQSPGESPVNGEREYLVLIDPRGLDTYRK